MNRRDIDAVEPAPDWAAAHPRRSRLALIASAFAVAILLVVVTLASSVAIVVTVLRWMGVV